VAAAVAGSALVLAAGVACLLTALVVFMLGLVMDTIKMHSRRDG